MEIQNCTERQQLSRNKQSSNKGEQNFKSQPIHYELGKIIFKSGVTKQQILKTVPKKLYKKRTLRKWLICDWAIKIKKEYKIEALQLEKVFQIAQSIPFDELSIYGRKIDQQACDLYKSMIHVNFDRLKILDLNYLRSEPIIEKIQHLKMHALRSFSLRNINSQYISFRKANFPSLIDLQIHQEDIISPEPLSEFYCPNLLHLYWKKKTHEPQPQIKKTKMSALFKLYPHLSSKSLLIFWASNIDSGMIS